MSNFWGKLKEFFQPEGQQDKEDTEIDLSYPEEIPLDEKFADYFVKGGGHFLYCENIQTAIKYLHQIIQNERLSRLVCFDEKLQKILNTLSLHYIDYPSASADGCFIGCESLIAYNGSVMISSHQSGGRSIGELPNTYVIYATPNQIEENLKEAMTTINRNKSGRLPNGITSIGGVDASQIKEENAQPPRIFLLLVEE